MTRAARPGWNWSPPCAGWAAGLADVRRVLAGNVTVAEVAATHVAALDTQIRTLRLHRAVLASVARRGSTASRR